MNCIRALIFILHARQEHYGARHLEIRNYFREKPEDTELYETSDASIGTSALRITSFVIEADDGLIKIIVLTSDASIGTSAVRITSFVIEADDRLIKIIVLILSCLIEHR